MIKFLYGKNVYDSWNSYVGEKELYAKNLDVEVKLIHGDEVRSLSELLSSSDSFGLFSKKTIIFVKRLFRNKSKKILEELCDYISGGRDLDIVFWEDGEVDRRTKLFKTLQKIAECKEFNSPKPGELVFWTRKKLEEKGLKATDRVINTLISRVGIEQNSLQNEINKLALFLLADNRSEITIKDIEEICILSLEENIWEFIDKLTSESKGRALVQLETLLSGVEDYQILIGLIVRQLKLIYLVSLMGTSTSQQIAQRVKERPFVISKIQSLVRNINTTKISKAFERLINLDRMVKNSQIDPILGLDLFVLSL